MEISHWYNRNWGSGVTKGTSLLSLIALKSRAYILYELRWYRVYNVLFLRTFFYFKEEKFMKRMLSGIKPTGRVTLGNYIGAIKPFVSYTR